jgi:hypothetical protein
VPPSASSTSTSSASPSQTFCSSSKYSAPSTNTWSDRAAASALEACGRPHGFAHQYIHAVHLVVHCYSFQPLSFHLWSAGKPQVHTSWLPRNARRCQACMSALVTEIILHDGMGLSNQQPGSSLRGTACENTTSKRNQTFGEPQVYTSERNRNARRNVDYKHGHQTASNSCALVTEIMIHDGMRMKIASQNLNQT